MFTRSGQESARLRYCGTCHLSAEEFGLVKNYHSFVFQNVLRLEKYPLTLDPRTAEFSLLVAPIHSGRERIPAVSATAVLVCMHS